jgi:hypothetical protein
MEGLVKVLLAKLLSRGGGGSVVILALFCNVPAIWVWLCIPASGDLRSSRGEVIDGAAHGPTVFTRGAMGRFVVFFVVLDVFAEYGSVFVGVFSSSSPISSKFNASAMPPSPGFENCEVDA